MEKLIVEPGIKTPSINFSADTGILEIKGKSIPNDRQKTNLQNIKATSLRCVEFKYCVSGLLKDLDDETKFLTDIDLLVCWKNDIKEETETGYSIHSLVREGIEPYPSAQWRIKKGNASCQVLVLKEYLESTVKGFV